MPSEIRDSEEPLTLDLATMNERLMLALVRQHELTEEAQLLNEKLLAESVARKKAEEALVNAEKLASVGRMAAVLAHEINNPLEAVTNILFLAQSTHGMPDVAREYLEMADSELNRIAHITRQTLGFYRESSSPMNCPVLPLIDSVIDLLQAKRISKRAIVAKQCSESLEITAFQGELRQVLANVLLNSLDAICDRGRVIVRGSLSRNPVTEEPRIRITVSDKGLVSLPPYCVRSSILSLRRRARLETVSVCGSVSRLLRSITALFRFGLLQMPLPTERHFR